jgi:putative sugar O-methyltransferase
MTHRHLMDIMLEDMAAAPAEYRPTNFWQICSKGIIDDLRLFGFKHFRILPSSLTTWVPYGDLEQLSEHYHLFSQHDLDKPPFLRDFSQDTLGSPLKPFIVQGKVLTPTAMNYLRALTFLKQHVDTTPIQHVLEIGGGHSVLGEILLKDSSRPYFYINVDIPPLAAVATYYLQTLFGEENVLDYRQSREMEVIDVEQLKKQYRGAILCPWQLPRLRGHFELAVNMISFQEMEPHIVKNYASLVKTLTTHYVLLRNARQGKQLEADPFGYHVNEPTTREHYLEYFAPLKVVGIDSELFGEKNHSIESEVMILSKGPKN